MSFDTVPGLPDGYPMPIHSPGRVSRLDELDGALQRLHETISVLEHNLMGVCEPSEMPSGTPPREAAVNRLHELTQKVNDAHERIHTIIRSINL